MSSSVSYALDHVAGAWRMAGGDEGWREQFDRTTNGVFASFYALAYAAPPALLGYVLIYRSAMDGSGPSVDGLAFVSFGQAGFLLAHLLSFVLAWLAGLGVLLATARGLRQEAQVVDAILGFNWGQLIIVGVQSAVMVLIVFVPPTTATALSLFSILFEAAVLFGVARRAFEQSVALSIGIVLMVMLAFIAVYSLLAAVGSSVSS